MVWWELRLRTPRGVDNVMIKTFTADEREAVELGNVYIDDLASPSIRFVGVRPIVVKSSVEVPALVAKYGPPQTMQEPAPPLPPVPVTQTPAAAAAAPALSGDTPVAILETSTPDPDDIGDEMSGPRVANPKPAPKRSRIGQ